MQFLYSLFIRFYGLLILFASLFNKKAEKWIAGRKNTFHKLEKDIDTSLPWCWIHCASAGEFEQALPVISEIRKQNPGLRIAASFFSPSGYELYMETNLADAWFYLPLDTKENAIRLCEILQPHFVIFIRNETWWNVLSVLKRKNISAYLLNADLDRKRNFLYQFYLDKIIPLFKKIFDQQHVNTKLERVNEIVAEPFKNDVLEEFCSGNKILVLGSSWEAEEKMAAAFYAKHKSNFPQLRIIIAPHEYHDDKREVLEKLYQERVNMLSENKLISNSSILFIDQKGLLKYIYRYADIAFIGGGFHKSVHNVSEAAVYGIPTIFGPAYEKFKEVSDMVKLNAAFPVTNSSEFENVLLQFLKNEISGVKEILKNYFAGSGSSSGAVVSEILREINPGSASSANP